MEFESTKDTSIYQFFLLNKTEIEDQVLSRRTEYGKSATKSWMF